MGAKILMIEDEAGIILTVGDRLAAEGFDFESCPDGIAGEAIARNGNHDLILLDVMLPGKDGFAVCESLP